MHLRAVSVAVLLASAAAGQEPVVERVLYVRHAATLGDLREVAVVIRAVADIRDVSIDEAQKAVAVRGTPARIAMAEWLASELDQVRPGENPGPREYRVPGSADGVVRIFWLVHAATPQDLQEMATLLRSTADIRYLFVYSAPKALALRGKASQIAIAAWLVDELDRARQDRAPGPHEYVVPGGADDVVRLFYLAHAGTPQELQRMATEVRRETNIARLFVNSAQRAVALRATASQVAQVERLMGELDKAR